MILEKINIGSFGRYRNREIVFTPGLNIVFGKNEAGKSTLYSIIDHLLFTDTNLRKPVFDKLLRRWLPASGGDTVSGFLRAGLEDGGVLEIEKSWGSAKVSELRFDGGTYTDEAAIRDIIDGHWNCGAGTIRQVCMLGQGTLSDTVPNFRQDKTVLASLSDVLQSSLVESGGVSVAAVIDKVEEECLMYFNSWDRLRDCPKDGRGIENPIKRNVGEVLKRYYEYLELKAESDRVEKVNKELISLEEDRSKKAAVLEQAEAFLADYREIYRTAGERRTLQAEAELLARTEEDIKGDRRLWLDTEKSITERGGVIDVLQKQAAELEAAAASNARQTADWKALQRFRQLSQLRDRYQASLQELEKTSEIPEEELKAMKRDHAAFREAYAKLSAGNLHAAVKALKDISFTIQPGIDEEQRRDLLAGNDFELDGKGRIIIKHSDFEVTVSAGDDYGEVEELYRRSRQNYEQRCGTYGVKNLEEAEQLRQQYREAERKAADERKRLEAALGGDDYDQLTSEVEQIGEIEEPEHGAVIEEQRKHAAEKLADSKRKLAELEGKMKKLLERYASEDAILEAQVDLKVKQKELDTRMAELPPLPEEFSSVEELIRDYEEKQDKAAASRQQLHALEQEILRCESGLPDVSAQELEAQTEQARLRYEKTKAEGDTLLRILDTASKIREEIQQNPFSDFVEKAEHYLSVVSGGRYRRFEKMGKAGPSENPIPTGITAEGGVELVYEQLSGGTKDVLSLSLRLAMADYFMEEKRGFLLLDDPLVDMDPERQAAAAGAIRDAAERYQCILFTCHPGVLDLFPDSRTITIAYE